MVLSQDDCQMVDQRLNKMNIVDREIVERSFGTRRGAHILSFAGESSHLLP